MSKIFKHKQTGRYVEINRVEHGIVSFFPLGGGFSQSMSDAHFNEQFEEVTDDSYLILHPCLVANDCCESYFFAYCNDQRWNGWAMPWFTRAQIEEIAKLMDDLVVTEDRVFAGFEVRQYADEGEVYNGYAFEDKQVINRDGEIVWEKLCQLGDGWCWDFVWDFKR